MVVEDPQKKQATKPATKQVEEKRKKEDDLVTDARQLIRMLDVEMGNGVVFVDLTHIFQPYSYGHLIDATRMVVLPNLQRVYYTRRCRENERFFPIMGGSEEAVLLLVFGGSFFALESSEDLSEAVEEMRGVFSGEIVRYMGF